VVLFILRILGWLVARTPERLLCRIAEVLGDFILNWMPRRRRVVLSNLHHAFPEKSAAWHRAIGRESCRRLVETGLLSLATPFLDERRFREIIRPTPGLLACFAEHRARPAPTLICSPHLAYWEAQTAMSLVVPGSFPEFGIIFRPLDNAAVNAFVKRSRERFGMTLLSRKEGFAAALKTLRRQGFVGVLFDQNSGPRGALATLFGRVCSTTELPGLMAEKMGARVYGICPIRRGFWRVEINVQRIPSDGTSTGVTIALNRWLEDLLMRDESLCASWLWAHDRWRHQDAPAQRFRLVAKRDLLAADLAARGLRAPPRRTRIWIRLPNWLGDVILTLPLVRALRLARPDAELTLVTPPQFVPLLQEWNVADRLHPLPPRGPGYFAHFRRLRGAFPDVWLLFTNSFRGDLEARLTGCRQRFGLVRPGKPRPLLTHCYHVPASWDERSHHQLELWHNFLRHFGLAVPPDLTPFANPGPGTVSAAPIGLIAGSENMPGKRWPVAHWRALIDSLPDQNFALFGTAADNPITSAVAAGFDSRVENLAGRTDLATFARRLRGCRLVVANDTGGMHLANALGVPLIALFGPTNPTQTGPIFASDADPDSPPVARILRPREGALLADLSPGEVLAHVRELLAALALHV